MKKAKGLWNKYSEKYNVLCTLNSHVQVERTRFKKANGWHPCICRSTMLCWSKSTLRAWKFFCNNAIEAPDSHGKTWNYNPFEEIKSKILMLCQVDVLQGGEPIYQTIPTSRSSYYQEVTRNSRLYWEVDSKLFSVQTKISIAIDQCLGFSWQLIWQRFDL
jgi:hypothetical protein